MINGHAVVVATCPQGKAGNVNAGRLTGSMFKTFPNIRMAVLVGIGGGIPSMFKTFPNIRMVVLVGVGSEIPRTPPSQHPPKDIHLG